MPLGFLRVPHIFGHATEIDPVIRLVWLDLCRRLEQVICDRQVLCLFVDHASQGQKTAVVWRVREHGAHNVIRLVILRLFPQAFCCLELTRFVFSQWHWEGRFWPWFRRDSLPCTSSAAHVR